MQKKSDQVSGILDAIKKQLQELPTEQPPGSEDIYGQDISLGFMSDDFQWINGKTCILFSPHLFVLLMYLFFIFRWS